MARFTPIAEGRLLEMDRKSRLEARIEAASPDIPVPQRICTESIDLLSVSNAALILMSQEESGAMVVASGNEAAQVDDLLLTVDEGPCFDAYEEGEAVLEPDLMAGGSRRWPEFATAAMETGVRAVFALPMQIGAARVGVFYLNRNEPGALEIEQLADASVLAEMATVAVLDTQVGAATGELGRGLNGTWAHRAVVHQATGMLSAQLGIPIDRALRRLRAHAHSSNTDVYSTARGVVEGRVRIEP